MAGVNKVIIVGNLGQDPEVKFMPSGESVANISIATSETWKDKQTGEQKEKTEWHRVSMFGKLAKIAGEYLKKGSKVYIEGKLQTRKWQNAEGKDQYTTEVVLQGYNGVMQMLDGKQQGEQAPQQQAQGGYQKPQQQGGGFQQQHINQAPPQNGGFNNQGGYQAPQQQQQSNQGQQQQAQGGFQQNNQQQQQNGGFNNQGQQQQNSHNFNNQN